MNDVPASAAPEGAVICEGPSLSEAITEGAAQLGLNPSMVEHKLDVSHFRNPETGAVMGMDTVRVWVWPKDQEEIKVVEAARAWMSELIERMELGGEVGVDVRGGTVMLRVRTEAGGRLVGRQGATLEAVQTLLTATLGPDFPRYEFRVDVADARRESRDRDDDRRERRGRRDRDDDRRERRGRRDRDDGRRESRDRGDDRRERRGRSRKPRGSDGPVQDDEANAARNREVERLAHRLAKKVQETGEPELIRREMNSYARRLVHMVVAEYPGLATESVGEGPMKRVKIVPGGGSAETAES